MNIFSMFHVFVIWGVQAFSLNISSGFNIELYCLYQSCTQTLVEIHRNNTWVFMNRAVATRDNIFGFILLSV